MDDRITPAATRGARPARAVVLALFAAAACGTLAQAQTPKAAAKPQPKAATPPSQPGGATQPLAGTPADLAWSAWTKFCDRASDTSSRGTCFTTQYGQIANGATAVVATVIEVEGKKALRVTVPLAVQLAQGMRVVIDQGQPMKAPYRVCASNGCEADFEASEELIEQLKSGQSLTVQSIDYQGYELSFPMPLFGFAKAYGGAPTDLQAEQKLQEELQKRAEEARKRLEVPPAQKK